MFTIAKGDVADCRHWYYVCDMSATALSDKAAVVSLHDTQGVVCVDTTGVGGGHQCSWAVEGERGL